MHTILIFKSPTCITVLNGAWRTVSNSIQALRKIMTNRTKSIHTHWFNLARGSRKILESEPIYAHLTCSAVETSTDGAIRDLTIAWILSVVLADGCCRNVCVKELHAHYLICIHLKQRAVGVAFIQKKHSFMQIGLVWRDPMIAWTFNRREEVHLWADGWVRVAS